MGCRNLNKYEETRQSGWGAGRRRGRRRAELASGSSPQGFTINTANASNRKPLVLPILKEDYVSGRNPRHDRGHFRRAGRDLHAVYGRTRVVEFSVIIRGKSVGAVGRQRSLAGE